MDMWSRRFTIVSIVLLGICLGSVSAADSIFRSQAVQTEEGVTGPVLLNIPPRRMWGWGAGMNGYCGETSFQSAGIFFGNYVSQERVRYADGNEELLIGVNDQKAAKALKLEYEVWDFERKSTPQASKFLEWIKGHIDQGHPVIAGWYEKQPRGDEDYDHIMPILGYENVKGYSKTLDNGTVVAVPTSTNIYHNDLYLQEVSVTRGADAFKSRSQCTQKKSPVQPYDYCLPSEYDYGIAIKGVVDPNKLTFRTVLTVSIWEEPDWGAEDKKHETPISFTVKATMSGLKAGTKYTLLRFDSADKLGDSKNFLKASYAARYDFTPTSDTHTLDNLDALRSDGSYFFRCVKAE